MVNGVVNNIKSSEQEFNNLVHQFSLPLYIYAKRNMHSNIDAEDVVQECFVRLWEKMENITDIKSVKNYLYTMVRNECINRLKSKKVVEYRENYDTNNSSVDNVDEFDAIELMIVAIDALPPQYSKIMKCSAKGMHIKEIAEELDIAESSVKVMKTRSIKKLRNILGDEVLSILITIIS